MKDIRPAIRRFTDRYIYGDRLTETADGEYVLLKEVDCAVTVGWMVGAWDGSPALYNLQEREAAFDAARRWNKPIVALICATPSNAPAPQD